MIENALELGTQVSPLGSGSPDDLSVSGLSGVFWYLFLSIFDTINEGILCQRDYACHGKKMIGGGGS